MDLLNYFQFEVAGSRIEDLETPVPVIDIDVVARNLARCAERCPTWVQTCMFRWDGALPTDTDIDAWLAVLEAAGTERLRGVLLYGVARPSMQAEAPRISTLTVDELEAIAERARKKGLTVRVSP